MSTEVRTYRVELFPEDIVRIMAALNAVARMQLDNADRIAAGEWPGIKGEVEARRLDVAQLDRIRECVRHAVAEESRIP